jgi:hypothetical protein
MSQIVTELRSQVRESTYSSDREDALEQLAELYPDADESERRSIGRTLVDVATGATYGDERRLAQEKLDELFRDSAPDIEGPAVTVHRRLAIDGDRTEERERALDRLREYQQEGLSVERLDEIRETYEAVIDEATYEDERRLARDGLAELERLDLDDAAGGSGSGSGDESDAYLAVSLAEHLDEAADQSPEACAERLDELRSFVEESPVDDDAYGEVRDELSEQLRQLESAPTDGDSLDPERRERITRLAERVRRLYLRSG